MNILHRIFSTCFLLSLAVFFASSDLWSYSQPPVLKAPAIVEVQTAAPGVIVVVVETGPHLNTTYVNPIDTTSSGYHVDGQVPTAVYLYSIPYDELPYDYDLSLEDRGWYVTVRHRIYLDIGQSFQTDHAYTISTPYGDTTFTYNDRNAFCESIKVNQVGYTKGSTVRYAIMGVFMGNGGTKSFSPLPSYQVIRQDNGSVVASGTAQYIGNDTAIQPLTTTAASGEYVYRLSLNSVPEGGLYYVSVAGFGRSFSFGVGTDYTRFAAYTYMRGFYHHRCGIALEPQFTDYSRAICHTHVDDIRYPFKIDDGIPGLPSGEPIFEIHGGYHDAGDCDRKMIHCRIPLMMMGVYEAFKDHFVDGQYNIPESGNGIPDILDEAMWGTLSWEYLQVKDTTDADFGGVRSGTEQGGYTTYGKQSAATDETVDNIIYGTYSVTVKTTAYACGLFANLSRLLTEGGYLPDRAADLKVSAEQAWVYLERNVPDMHATTNYTSHFNYAALQMYLLTGDQKYHDLFKEYSGYFNYHGVPGDPEYWIPGCDSYVPTSFVSYVLPQTCPIDEATATMLKGRIFYFADRGMYMETFPENQTYPSGVSKAMGWGASTAQGRYAEIYMYAYALTNDPAKKQQYFNIISQYSDFALGLNPLNMSFVTGLGTVQPVSPCNADSYFTKYGKSDGVTSEHVGKPIGNVPGILIYGPTNGRSGGEGRLAVTDKLYPVFESLPYLRHWGDGWSCFTNNEYTIAETMIWNTVMFGFLYNASQDSNCYNFKNPNSVKTNPSPVSNYSLYQNYPNPFNPSTKITFSVGKYGYTSIKIYDILGREIITLVNGMHTAGEHTVEWNGKNSVGQRAGSGVYFYQLKTGSGFSKTQKMILLN